MDEDTFTCRVQYVNDADPFATTATSYLEPMRPITFTFRLHDPIGEQISEVIRTLRAPHKPGDAALQVYKGSEGGGGEFHTYLDSELTLSEQPDEFDILKSDTRRSSLVVRTQTPLRVKTIVDKLLNASGRDQRRALFSLKQIFQDDKDLVHEFVQNGGLDCMIKLGRVADQNHQNYILRALGQVMLYVDGMNGIIAHNATIQWLYELLDSPLYDPDEVREMSPYRVEWFRLVVKTALKLLLVFIEYNDNNALLVLTAVNVVDKMRNRPDWTALMKVISEKDSPDSETLVYGLTVINKALHGIPDRDTFYDAVDTLDNLGMEDVMKQLQKTGDREILEQCRLYERELNQEDERGESDEDATAKLRRGFRRESVASKSTPPSSPPSNVKENDFFPPVVEKVERASEPSEVLRISDLNRQIDVVEAPSQQSQRSPAADNDRKSMIKRRHMEAQLKQQEHLAFNNSRNIFNKQDEHIPVPEPKSSVPWRNEIVAGREEPITNGTNGVNGLSTPHLNGHDIDITPAPAPIKKVPEPLRLVENQENEQPKEPEDEHHVKAPPPSFPQIFSPTESKTMDFPEPVKEPEPEPEPEKPVAPRAKIVRDDAGGGFAAMLQRRAAKASESNANSFQPRESEAEIQWKKAAESLKTRPLIINDLDFSEFHSADLEQDPLVMARLAQVAQEKNMIGGGGGFRGIPGAPPPPPPPGGIPLPPRLQGGVPQAPPLPGGGPPPPPPPNGKRETSPGPHSKGVLKLHWKPTSAEPPPVPSLKQKGSFWNGIDMPHIDANRLVSLFETKQAKEAVIKQKQVEAKPQELRVLPLKRSQAISIGLTKLPPMSVIPAAIMKFDSQVLNKDGIEKILRTMMPSPKEIEEIENKAAENPDQVLGQAEQFLLKLSQIPCLLERLKLWIFTLDYQNIEKDIAEPLMDMQLAMKEMEESKTFRTAMGILLAMGNSLSGTEIKGFQLDYLTSWSQVKDPVYKHPLTYHLAEYMIEHCPDGTDLYSEFGAVARSSKIDYKELHENLQRLEKECKVSWEYLAKISKSDNTSMKQKINKYLVEVAERIHQLKDIHRIARHRWHGFLLYFGYNVQEIPDQKPNDVFKMVTEFALEYRTTRDKILQQRKRMAEKRERNKTRGKIWALEGNGEAEAQPRRRVGAAPPPQNAQERHDEMSRILTNLATGGDGTLRRRGRGATPEKAAPKPDAGDGDSPDDEILNSLAKAATLPSEGRDHRRKARQFNRKSLRRTRTLRLIDGQIETSDY